jgi:F0F1-type ATP synthase membrane subunit c/vacuolar-type H+-ATPase subunit K
MEQTIALIWAGLAVWLAWFWVVIGQWELSRVSMDILGRNPMLRSQLLIFTVLWIALVESGAIYGMIIAFKIINSPWIDPMHAIWSGLAIGLASMGSGFWESKVVCWSLEAFNRNPENKAQVLQSMLLYLALAEVVSIYALIIAFQLLK